VVEVADLLFGAALAPLRALAHGRLRLVILRRIQQVHLRVEFLYVLHGLLEVLGVLIVVGLGVVLFVRACLVLRQPVKVEGWDGRGPARLEGRALDQELEGVVRVEAVGFIGDGPLGVKVREALCRDLLDLLLEDLPHGVPSIFKHVH